MKSCFLLYKRNKLKKIAYNTNGKIRDIGGLV